MSLRTYAVYRKRRKLLRLLALFLLLFLLFHAFLAAKKRFFTLAAMYGESHCRNQISLLMLDAIDAALPGEALFSQNETEAAPQLTLNAAAVSRCRTRAGQQLQKRLSELATQTQNIALGTLLQSPFLLDKGTKIPLRMIPVGDGTVQVKSNLEESGINQVLYSLSLEITVTVTMILPGETRELTCQERFPLAQTLISGQVPSLYAPQ